MIKHMWRLMVDFLRDFFFGIIRGTKKHWKGMIIFLVVAVIVVIAGLLLMLEATKSPKFCALCHSMKPYVASWAKSSHKDVNCIDCHFKPGFLNELRGKWKAQIDVVAVMTAQVPTKFHADIDNSSCMREGCHTKQDIHRHNLVFHGVHFDHGRHMKELRNGKELRCITCHTQFVSSNHMTVSDYVCFQCHFYDTSKYPKLRQCKICHTQKIGKIYIDGNPKKPYNHDRYVKRGVKCETCHTNVIHGDGHVVNSACYHCHAEPEIVKAQMTSSEIHKIHVTENKVECFYCHTIIKHSIVRNGKNENIVKNRMAALTMKNLPLDANCFKCHSANQHALVRDMYTGTGGKGIKPIPDAMYKANLDCAICHLQVASGAKQPFTFQKDPEQIAKSCIACHGKPYGALVSRWNTLLGQEIKKTEKAVAEAEKLTDQAKGTAGAETLKKVTALMKIATYNLGFVKLANGVHNFVYAMKLLTVSQEKAQEAIKLVKPGVKVGKVVSPVNCQTCHGNMANVTISFGSVKFPHQVHVEDQDLECTQCHTSYAQHGQTLIKGCSDCHHGEGQGAVKCEDCHTQTSVLYRGLMSPDGRKHPDAMAKSVSCKECHVAVANGDDMSVASIKKACVKCHEKKYGKMVDTMIVQSKELMKGMGEHIAKLQASVLAAFRKGEYLNNAQEWLNRAEREYGILSKGNAIHNLKYAKILEGDINQLLAKVEKVLKNPKVAGNMK